MILSVTGHRPNKLGGYSPANLDKLARFATSELRRFDPAPSRVLTGMALGFDQCIALACIELDIPFVACIPHDGQESPWPPDAQRRYRDLIGHAASVHVVCPGGYAAWKMQRRNEYMVENCELLLGLWDGSAGGTANCIRYAQSRIVLKVKVENCWERWVAFR